MISIGRKHQRKSAQWIGKSVGAMVSFKVNGHQENISVFTTRPDTILGNLYDIGSRASLVTQLLTKRKRYKPTLKKTSNDRKRTYG
jgi:leucyl-tRNA synthetase